MNESDLIQGARQGNLEAFNDLALCYQDQVFQYTVWMLDEQQAAEMVTQRTFLLAFQHAGEFHGVDFAFWLLRIANRLCFEELGRRDRARASAPSAPGKGRDGIVSASPVADFTDFSSGDLVQKDLEKTVSRGLMTLPPVLRAVLTLGDIQGVNHTQIATILEISESDVQRHLASARRRMSELILAQDK
jgi:RNA polymerase sigma-70 factor (ECF subfamily)